MFAKLDDLEGQVELFIGDAASEQALAVELDRWSWSAAGSSTRTAGITSLRVQDAELFEPDAAEIARAQKNAAPGGAHALTSTPRGFAPT